MEKKKSFSKHGIMARMMSFILAFAMVVTMGAFSQIGQIVVKADQTSMNVKVHVNIPAEWEWVSPAIWYQGENVQLSSVGEGELIAGWGDSDYGYPLTKESEDSYYGIIKGNLTNLQFVDVKAPAGRCLSGAYDANMAQYTDENPQDLYYFYVDSDGDEVADTWKWYKDSERNNPLSTTADITLYYYCDSWTSAYCHSWGNGIAATTWPGTQMEQVKENWYKAEVKNVPSNADINCILNNNNGGQTGTITVSTDQAVDGAAWILSANSGAVYTEPEEYTNAGAPVVPEEPEITTCNLTVHYKNAYGDDPAIYMYNGDDKIAGAWPGTYLVADEDHEGWYYAHLSVSAEKDYKVIFNGKGGQTTDLTGMVTTGKATAEYWYDASAEEPLSDTLPDGWSYKTTVHYYAPTWTSANVYVFGGDESISGTGVGAGWPGAEATPVTSACGNAGWFDAVYYQNVKADFKCIFNFNGSQTNNINVQVTSANTELWVSGLSDATEVSTVAPASWKGEDVEPYKFKIYYCNPDSPDTDAASSTKDLWMWNAGLSGSYEFTGTWYDEDNQVTWLTQEIEVDGQYVGKEVGLIARYDYTKDWDGGSDAANRSFQLDGETEIYYYLDGNNPTSEKPVITLTDPRYVSFEYLNPSLAEDLTPCFYSWTIGGVNAKKLIPMEKQSDGSWNVKVKVAPTCEKVDFVIALDTTGNSWIKDGGDHSIVFPLEQNAVFAKMNVGEEPSLSAPYNIGYEILPEDNKINFYYRDDEKAVDNTLAQMTVSAEVNGGLREMTYSTANRRFELSLPLIEGEILYRYKVGEEYVLDAFNQNVETSDSNEYSYMEYYKLEAEIRASVMNSQFNYNENNVVKFEVVQDKTGSNASDPDIVVTSATVDVSALGGSNAMAIEPELQAVTISATVDTSLGVKTLPITVIDQFGNEFTTSVDVEMIARQKTDAADDFDWDEAIIYFMVTDRFFDGNSSNNEANGAETYGSNAGLYHGGDFVGVTAKLDYLQDLGINTIWITPIVENIQGVTVEGTGSDEVPYNAAYHGYWASDFTKLNPALGTATEFETMISEAHKRGIKIMVDIVVNHAGYGTEADFNSLLGSEAMIRSEEETVSGSDQKSSLAGLPDFRTEDSDVRAKLVEWQTDWIRNFDIDYFRVDTVKHVEGTTWAALKNSLTQEDSDFKMIGEYAGGGYAGNGGTLGTGQMDSDLDFDFNDQATGFVNGRITDVENFLSKRNQKLDNTYMTGQFLGSHDEDGFKYKLMNDGMSEADATAAALVAASLQITAKGQPVIYYGEEIGLTGANNYPYQTNRYDFDWSLTTSSNKTYQHYKKMLAIRNDFTDVFARGTRTTLTVSDEDGIDVFAREYENEKVVVALNIGSAAKSVAVSGLSANTRYYDNYSGKYYTSDANGKITLSVPAAKDGGTVVLSKKDALKYDEPEPTDEKEPEKSNVTITINADGSSKEVVKTTEENKAGKEVAVTTTTKKDKDGNVVSVTETSKIENAAKNTTVTVTVKYDADGNVTSSKASVTKVSSGNTVSLTGSVISQIKEAAGTKTDVSLKVTDTKGKTLYTVKADTSEVKPGASLYIYKLNTKTGEYTAVNAKKYKVTDKGTVSVTMSKKATYELVTAKKAKAIDKKILATVKTTKSSVSVKEGKTTTVSMSKKLNMDNVQSITYKVSDKKVATVSKSGKVTAKEKGTVTVNVTVILKNGKSKTVKMKVTVK